MVPSGRVQREQESVCVLEDVTTFGKGQRGTKYGEIWDIYHLLDCRLKDAETLIPCPVPICIPNVCHIVHAQKILAG